MTGDKKRREIIEAALKGDDAGANPKAKKASKKKK